MQTACSFIIGLHVYFWDCLEFHAWKLFLKAHKKPVIGDTVFKQIAFVRTDIFLFDGVKN